MKFRPCIDLHAGKVKQIVGSSLSDNPGSATLQTNFETEKSAAEFAALYRKHNLLGGHVIMLGPGNDEQALLALREYPGGLQIGGGINSDNAASYLQAGASHVIVTSCRSRDGVYYVVTDRWQTFTDFEVSEENLKKLAGYCDEFLVHGVDVEGMRCGIMEDLVEKLGRWSPIPVTYAGGARSLDDLDLVERLGQGRVDLTIGSALDIFGGAELALEEVVAWHLKRNPVSIH